MQRYALEGSCKKRPIKVTAPLSSKEGAAAISPNIFFTLSTIRERKNYVLLSSHQVRKVTTDMISQILALGLLYCGQSPIVRRRFSKSISPLASIDIKCHNIFPQTPQHFPTRRHAPFCNINDIKFYGPLVRLLWRLGFVRFMSTTDVIAILPF